MSKEYNNFTGFSPVKVTKDNHYGCRKCRYEEVCMYCGLDLRGYTEEHSDNFLNPYDVLVLGATERYYYKTDTVTMCVPVRFVEELKETIEAYHTSTVSDNLKKLNVNHTVFVLYPDNKDFDKRKQMAIDYIHKMLKDNGYTTHKEHYEVGYNAGAGKDCIEVLVVGDFNVESFVGNIK